MSQYINTSPLQYPTRMTTFLHTIFHNMRMMTKIFTRFESVPASALLAQVEAAATGGQLTKAVNNVQDRLWSLPEKEQATLRQLLVHALTTHVHKAAERSLRLEAVRWLRLLVQAGVVTQPKAIFATFVTAVTHSTEVDEQRAYLKLLFECFWPFRHPYPAYSWEDFPPNEVFYPLAPLLAQANAHIQSALLAIFAELPTLDDEELSDFLLPVALHWSQHSNPEYRRRISDVLARMNVACAQEALQRLLSDADPTVQSHARRAASYTPHS